MPAPADLVVGVLGPASTGWRVLSRCAYGGAMAKKKWSDLSTAAKAAVVLGAAAELVLTTYAVRDLKRRPKATVRGPKLLWYAALSVQPVGPVVYLARGRRT